MCVGLTESCSADGTDQAAGMLSVRLFGPGGCDREYRSRIFWWPSPCGPLRRCHSGKGRAVPDRPPANRPSLADQSGGIIMNTAMARRLALGDRVVRVGKNQPSAPGTITRITAHQVEVLWEGETARRYRRKQLHNLRRRTLICESPNPNEKPENCYCSALPKGSGPCLPCYTRWLAGRRA